MRTCDNCACDRVCDHNWNGFETCGNWISMDAVPVVRCRECKYRDGTPGQPNILCGQMHEDDFCSYGERKEGAD